MLKITCSDLSGVEEKQEFPQYRRLLNGRSWYRISARDRLEEIQVMGKYYFRHTLDARILPERLLIADLLENSALNYESVSADEYHNFVAWCNSNLEER